MANQASKKNKQTSD